MPLATSGSQLSVKNPRETKLPSFIAEKHRNLERLCPIEVQTKRFPIIKEALRKDVKKRRVHPGESTKDYFRSEVTLPKLKISEQRIDAGEPHSDYCFEGNNVDCVNTELLRWLGSSESRSEEEDNVSWYQDLLEASVSRLKISGKIKDYKEKEKSLEESNVLKRWQYWMDDKKRMLNYLSKRLGRNPQELLIQESDKYRKVVEQKLMFRYSRIPEPDKWRGSPARWKPELRIRDNKTQLYPTSYCLVKSKVDGGERPEIEVIGIPQLIKIEKGHLSEGMTESDERRKNTWRVHSVEEPRKCDSHEIEMKQLAVVGTRIYEKPGEEQTSVPPRITPSIIEPEFEVEENAQNCLDVRLSTFCLVIDGEEFKYEIGSEYCLGPDKLFDWEVNFCVNEVGSVTEKVLRVENRGTVAVRYDWISPKTEKKLSWSALHPKHYEPWFFFNKNSGFFLPGQIYYLKFYFHAKTSGIRKEIWYLKTDPPLSENIEFGTITISGVSTENFSNKEKSLDIYLHKRVLESTVSLIINVILYKVSVESEYLCGIEYRSIFNEKELFEYHNPKYYYHSLIVRELNGFFKEIALEVEAEWDLSLDSLISLVKSHKTGKDRTSTLREIALRARALLRPSYMSAKSVKKYKMTYGILCKMTNSMEEDYVYLRNLVSEKNETSSEIGEVKDSAFNSDSVTEEMGEWGSNGPMFQIKPINFIFFKTLLYVKVYRRICEAAEHIVGVLETRKFFEPWKEVNYKPKKPPRTVFANPHDEIRIKQAQQVKQKISIFRPGEPLKLPKKILECFRQLAKGFFSFSRRS